METDELSWRKIIKFLVCLAVAGGIIFAAVYYFGGNNVVVSYFTVFILGGLLGLTEIMGRYTDSPMAAMKSPGAFIYVLLNAIASCAALFLLLWLAPTMIEDQLKRILLASFGAMAFLRSSILNVKVQDEVVAVGPAVVLDTLLKFADAQVDRGRAIERAARISNIVKPLPLEQASSDLPRLCFALMQNVTADVRQRVLDEITLVVTDPKRSDAVKVLEIGLIVQGRVGFGALSGAIDAMREMNLPASAGAAAGATTTKASTTVPPASPKAVAPQDLIAEIQKQLALDRRRKSAALNS